MSYIHKPNIVPLVGMTPFQLVHQHVKAHPDKNAFVFRDKSNRRTPITFQEYENKSQSLAAGLLGVGLVRGDRVLVIIPSCPEFVFIQMALNRIGAVAIIEENYAFHAVKDVQGLACVVTHTDYTLPRGAKLLAEIQSALQKPSLKALIFLDAKVESNFPDNCRVHTYEKLLVLAEKNPVYSAAMVESAEALVQMDDPAFVMFTSGSTGPSKPIECNNHAFVNAGYSRAKAMKITENSVTFVDSPFDWIPGIGFGISPVIVLGSTMVSFPPKLAFSGKNTAMLIKAVVEEKCTNSFFLPYFFHDLALCEDTAKISKLTFCSTAGQSPVAPLLKRIFETLPGLTVINLYGSTETSVLAKQEITKGNIDSIDFGALDILPGYEMKVIDDNGQLVRVASQGQLCVRGSWVSFHNPDILRSTAYASTADQCKPSRGWHAMNDRVSLDSDCRLKLFGRTNSTIRCAITNVQPVLIEEILYDHPEVEKACVVGVPDQRLYEKICACIILREGSQCNGSDRESEFDVWCKDKFPVRSNGLVHKPHYFVFLGHFPLTRTGKISRRLVKEEAIKVLKGVLVGSKIS